MLTEDRLISILKEVGAFHDIINFYNDGDSNVEQTINDIGDAVHFALEMLGEADENTFNQSEENESESISYNSQRLMKG